MLSVASMNALQMHIYVFMSVCHCVRENFISFGVDVCVSSWTSSFFVYDFLVSLLFVVIMGFVRVHRLCLCVL